MSYTLMALSVMAATEPNLDDDHYAYNHNEVEKTDGIPDILREAKHGADFFLRSFAYADGEVQGMVTGVGDLTDHNAWLRCDSLDNYSYATERKLYKDLFPVVVARAAAGLVLLGKTYAKYDQAFADSCLMVAKELYDYGKKTVGNPFSGGYQTNGGTYNEIAAYDELAVAAIALHYATYEESKKKDYLNDAIYDTTIVDNINAKHDSLYFRMGWFGNTYGFNSNGWPNDFSDVQNFAMYAFYKLILVDEKTSEKFGIGKDERLALIEKILLSFANNLRLLGSFKNDDGPQNIDLNSLYKGFIMYYDGLRFTQFSGASAGFFAYGTGPMVSDLMYAKIADDLARTKTDLPGLSSADWKASAVRQLALNRMNYILGMNEWDMSFMVGVGDKNDSHIHHRTSNPEFANAIISKEFEKRKQEMMDTLDLSKYTADEIAKLEDDLFYELNTPTYSYRPLTGVLTNGPVVRDDFSQYIVVSDVENYASTDVWLWGNTEFLAALMLLSKEHSAVAADTTKKDSSGKKDKKDNLQESSNFVRNLNVVKLGSLLEVNYSLDVASPVMVKLVSVSGNVVRNYNGGNLGAGHHTVSFDMGESCRCLYSEGRCR